MVLASAVSQTLAASTMEGPDAVVVPAQASDSGNKIPTPFPSNVADVSRSINQKAEAFAEAHRRRVHAEAHVYLESENRKAEARGLKLQARAEMQRINEETKALGSCKREQRRADTMIQDAEIKANKIMAKAQALAHKIKSRANEVAEKAIADAKTRAERQEEGLLF